MRLQLPWVVHCSTAGLGGAEYSVLEMVSAPEFAQPGQGAMFLLPADGPLAQELRTRRIPYAILPFPEAWNRISRRKQAAGRVASLLAAVVVVPQTLRHLRGARSIVRRHHARTVLSVGLRSHCLLLFAERIQNAFVGRDREPGITRASELSPPPPPPPSCMPRMPRRPQHLWGAELVLNIRDFVRPVWLRAILTRAAARGRCTVLANSRAVGREYPGARVAYPVVTVPERFRRRNRAATAKLPAATPKPPAAGEPRAPGEALIFTHAAFFAPYKGQLEFLDHARRLLDAGHDARFWIVGDVLYPQPLYQAYRARVVARITELGLQERVTLWGLCTRERTLELLSQSSVLVHSTREPEPYGRIVMEALLCGCQAWCRPGSGVCERLHRATGGVGHEALAGQGLVRVELQPGDGA